MEEAPATDHVELTLGGTHRILQNLPAPGRIDRIQVVDPFRNVAAEVVHAERIDVEAFRGRGPGEAVGIVRYRRQNEPLRGGIRVVPRAGGNWKCVAPGIFELIALGVPCNEGPLRFGREPVARRGKLYGPELAAHVDVGGREGFLLAQPIAIRGRVLPRHLHHRVVIDLEVVPLDGARSVAGAELAKLAIRDFRCGHVERARELHRAQRFIGATAGLAA